MTKSMFQLKVLLGDELFNGENSSIRCKTEELNDKTIGLFFWSSWCDRCRKTTKNLIEIYRCASKANQNSNFDIVLIALDDNDEISEKMPWKILPFPDDDKAEALMKRYQIDDIPTLVIVKPDDEVFDVFTDEDFENEANLIDLFLNGKTNFWKKENQDENEFIWKNIRCHSCFTKPLIGERFSCLNIECQLDFCKKCSMENVHNHELTSFLTPTKTYSTDELFENIDFLMKNENEAKATKSIQDKYLGIYFSARWAEENEDFTRKLIEIYQNVSEINLPFEIIFISAEDDQKKFDQHVVSMPWKIISFEDQKTKRRLKIFYQIEQIPSLIILDPKGKLITKFGRQNVNQKGLEAIRTWCNGEMILCQDCDSSNSLNLK